MYVIGVKFKEGGKAYNFQSESSFDKGDKVIVETDKGVQLGEVDTCTVNDQKRGYKDIDRPATEEDYAKYLKNLKDAKEALKETKDLVKELDMNMFIIDASYTFDRKILLFNFISDERVDFRNLVKELASKYRTRIELHQVGVRDKAKAIGGLGLCGRTLCCHGALKNINSVNINMVKNQNIALNPTKINGACGRLLCCFTFENDLYEENRSKLPKIGEKVNYKGRDAEVTDLDILNLTYTVKTGDNSFEKVEVK